MMKYIFVLVAGGFFLSSMFIEGSEKLAAIIIANIWLAASFCVRGNDEH